MCVLVCPKPVFEPDFAGSDASPRRLIRHGKRLKGIGVGCERAGAGTKDVQRVQNCQPGENRSAGAGVFAIKNIRIDSGSSSIGQKKTLRPGQPGRTRMLRARPGARVLFLLIYLRD